MQVGLVLLVVWQGTLLVSLARGRADDRHHPCEDGCGSYESGRETAWI